MTTEPNLSAARLWADYVQANPAYAAHGQPIVEGFGDSPAITDELLALVADGRKRATASLVADYEHEPLPRIGAHWVVTDGLGRARVVLRTTELRLGSLESVDDRFAWDEGEGERGREWWLDAHRRYFRRSCERLGLTPPDGDIDRLEVLFERFALVWPIPSR